MDSEIEFGEIGRLNFDSGVEFPTGLTANPVKRGGEMR